eukprot:UN34620
MIYTGDSQTQAALVPIMYGLGSVVLNSVFMAFMYWVGYSYADPNLSFVENFHKMAELRKMGGDEETIAKDSDPNNISLDNLMGRMGCETPTAST